jgi:hypothetical protein
VADADADDVAVGVVDDAGAGGMRLAVVVRVTTDGAWEVTVKVDVTSTVVWAWRTLSVY